MQVLIEALVITVLFMYGPECSSATDSNQWMDWSPWSVCSVTCSRGPLGSRARFRTCFSKQMPNGIQGGILCPNSIGNLTANETHTVSCSGYSLCVDEETYSKVVQLKGLLVETTNASNKYELDLTAKDLSGHPDVFYKLARYDSEVANSSIPSPVRIKKSPLQQSYHVPNGHTIQMALYDNYNFTLIWNVNTTALGGAEKIWLIGLTQSQIPLKECWANNLEPCQVNIFEDVANPSLFYSSKNLSWTDGYNYAVHYNMSIYQMSPGYILSDPNYYIFLQGLQTKEASFGIKLDQNKAKRRYRTALYQLFVIFESEKTRVIPLGPLLDFHHVAASQTPNTSSYTLQNEYVTILSHPSDHYHRDYIKLFYQKDIDTSYIPHLARVDNGSDFSIIAGFCELNIQVTAIHTAEIWADCIQLDNVLVEFFTTEHSTAKNDPTNFKRLSNCVFMTIDMPAYLLRAKFKDWYVLQIYFSIELLGGQNLTISLVNRVKDVEKPFDNSTFYEIPKPNSPLTDMVQTALNTSYSEFTKIFPILREEYCGPQDGNWSEIFCPVCIEPGTPCSRTCNNPLPRSGGFNCSGPSLFEHPLCPPTTTQASTTTTESTTTTTITEKTSTSEVPSISTTQGTDSKSTKTETTTSTTTKTEESAVTNTTTTNRTIEMTTANSEFTEEEIYTTEELDTTEVTTKRQPLNPLLFTRKRRPSFTFGDEWNYLRNGQTLTPSYCRTLITFAIVFILHLPL